MGGVLFFAIFGRDDSVTVDFFVNLEELFIMQLLFAGTRFLSASAVFFPLLVVFYAQRFVVALL